VFGPQKGASREDVALLDGALTRWADVLEAHLDVSVRDRPGAGRPAGSARRCTSWARRSSPGIALVQEAVGSRSGSRGPTWSSPARGGSTAVPRRQGRQRRRADRGGARRPVRRAGRGRAAGRREAAAAGIEQAWSLVDLVGAERALADAGAALSELAAHVAGQWSAGRRLRRAILEGSGPAPR
jgi:glycerate kinase